MPTNDIPATNAELDGFYGVPATQAEINEAISRHTRAFNKDDLAELMYEHGEFIIATLEDDMAHEAGLFIKQLRKDLIASRASYELYGKPDIIKPSQVE